jgi:uncharacterized protein YaeQ
MALGATIYKFNIDLSNMDKHRYESVSQHIALHPSETLERMVLRLLAYCVNMHDQLRFTKGLSSDTEPDLWQKSYTDEIELWIELGLPDIKRIKKAASISHQVKLYVYGGQAVDQWWKLVQKDCQKFKNVDVYRFDLTAVSQFVNMIERSMRISVMIQDGLISFSWDDQMLEFPMETIHDQDQS